MPPSMKNWSTAVTLSTCALILWVVSTRPAGPTVLRDSQSLDVPADEAYFQVGLDPNGDRIPQDDPQWASLMPGRSWIGISCCLPSEIVRAQLQLPPGTGLAVIDVVKGGPADRAGIQPHDVLTGVGSSGDAAMLATPQDLFAAVETHGEKPLTLNFLRQAQRVSATLTPEERPPELSFQQVTADALSPDLVWTIPQVVLPRGVVVELSRSARGPTRIRVRRGDEFWDATAADLTTLPAELRPVVQQLSSPAGMTPVVLADHPAAIPTPDATALAAAGELGSGISGGSLGSRLTVSSYRRHLSKHYQEVEQLKNAQREAAERLEQSQDVIERRLDELKGTLEKLLDRP